MNQHRKSKCPILFHTHIYMDPLLQIQARSGSWVGEERADFKI